MRPDDVATRIVTLPSTHPGLALLSSAAIGLLFTVTLILVVPWLDYAAERLNLNPFRWVELYFAWCRRKQGKER